MDPISVVVAALAAGALAGAQGTATEAVKDLYKGLKRRVKQHVAGRAAAETAVDEHETKPDLWGPVLKAELINADADADSELVATAQQLMTLLDPDGSRSGKYMVDLRGAQGIQVGDHNTQTNTFGGPATHRPRS